MTKNERAIYMDRTEAELIVDLLRTVSNGRARELEDRIRNIFGMASHDKEAAGKVINETGPHVIRIAILDEREKCAKECDKWVDY